jgi:5-methylcytosine-specific restriction endonuclease McrA
MFVPCVVCGARPKRRRHKCDLRWQIKVVRKKKWTPYFSSRGRRIFRPYEVFYDILWDPAGRYHLCALKHRRRKDAVRHAKRQMRTIQLGRAGVILTDVVPPKLPRSRTPVDRQPVPGLDATTWRFLREIWGNRCYYCGKGGGNLQREHRIPLARGGDNHISNIVPACGPCNRAKGILTDDEYFKVLADRFAYGDGGISVDGVAVEPSRPFPGPVSLGGDVVRVPSRGKRTRVELPPDLKRCPRCTRVLPLDASANTRASPTDLRVDVRSAMPKRPAFVDGDLDLRHCDRGHPIDRESEGRSDTWGFRSTFAPVAQYRR